MPGMKAGNVKMIYNMDARYFPSFGGINNPSGETIAWARVPSAGDLQQDRLARCGSTIMKELGRTGSNEPADEHHDSVYGT